MNLGRDSWWGKLLDQSFLFAVDSWTFVVLLTLMQTNNIHALMLHWPKTVWMLPWCDSFQSNSSVYEAEVWPLYPVTFDICINLLHLWISRLKRCYESLSTQFTSRSPLCFDLIFPGALHEESEEADEEGEEHDGEGHCDHAGVLLLVRVPGPSPRGLQREPRILQNLLQHLHGRKSGGGGQDHKGLGLAALTVLSDLHTVLSLSS